KMQLHSALRIGVRGVKDFLQAVDGRVQLFLYLARQGFFVRLALVNLASRKLPVAGEMRSAEKRTNEEGAVLLDHRGHNHDSTHRRSLFLAGLRGSSLMFVFGI